jgi:hypothetical protein
MKIRDYGGGVYSLREEIKGEILHSDHGEGQMEMLHNSVNQLADIVAMLIEVLADNKMLDEATVLKMCGYGASIEKDNA